MDHLDELAREQASQDPAEHPILARLSPAERAMLGQPLSKKSSRRYPTAEEYPVVRDWLVGNSQKTQPYLTPDMTAYTPGETLWLLDQPAYKAWHEYAANFKVPEGYSTVVFVPCAKTKPWDKATSDRASKTLYKSYNAIREQVAAGELPPVYFVTISEPLGIVPEENWGDFITRSPYDNPGLFPDPVMRAGGAHTSDWTEKFGKVMPPPYDKEAYGIAIDRLSDVIAAFMKNNPRFQYLAFVDDPNPRKPTTHGDMVRAANQKVGGLIDEANIFSKKPLPPKNVSAHAITPQNFMTEKIKQLVSWAKDAPDDVVSPEMDDPMPGSDVAEEMAMRQDPVNGGGDSTDALFQGGPRRPKVSNSPEDVKVDLRGKKFTPQNIRDAFGIPLHQARAVHFLADSMGLDMDKLRVAVGDDADMAVYEGEKSQTGFDQEYLRRRLNETSLVSLPDAAQMLGPKAPEYLDAVVEFMKGQREKAVAGKFLPSDVAKAYLLTLGSMHAGENNLAQIEKKTGLKFPPEYVTYNKDGVPMIRPEEAVAYWFTTEEGKTALDAVNRGDYRTEYGVDLFKGLNKLRDIFGNNDIRTNAFSIKRGGYQEAKNPGITMKGIQALTERINAARGDVGQISSALGELTGIGPAKLGFVKYLLGFGDTATADAVEINYWLTGQGDVSQLNTRQAELARDLKAKGSGNPGTQAHLQRLVQARLEGLYDLLGLGEGPNPIPKDYAIHFLHHWLWDKAKQAETTHQGMQTSMAGERDPALAQSVSEKSTRVVKGLIRFVDAEKAIMKGFSRADLGTAIHEMSHAARRLLFDRSIPAELRLGITDADIQAVEDWCGVAEDGIWHRDAEEAFAKANEQYFKNGFKIKENGKVVSNRPFSEAFLDVFHKIANWLKDIYVKITSGGNTEKYNPSPKGVSAPVRQAFDNLYTRNDRLREQGYTEEQIRNMRFVDSRSQDPEGTPPRLYEEGDMPNDASKKSTPVDGQGKPWESNRQIPMETPLFRTDSGIEVGIQKKGRGSAKFQLVSRNHPSDPWRAPSTMDLRKTPEELVGDINDRAFLGRYLSNYDRDAAPARGEFVHPSMLLRSSKGNRLDFYHMPPETQRQAMADAYRMLKERWPNRVTLDLSEVQQFLGFKNPRTWAEIKDFMVSEGLAELMQAVHPHQFVFKQPVEGLGHWVDTGEFRKTATNATESSTPRGLNADADTSALSETAGSPKKTYRIGAYGTGPEGKNRAVILDWVGAKNPEITEFPVRELDARNPVTLVFEAENDSEARRFLEENLLPDDKRPLYLTKNMAKTFRLDPKAATTPQEYEPFQIRSNGRLPAKASRLWVGLLDQLSDTDEELQKAIADHNAASPEERPALEKQVQRLSRTAEGIMDMMETFRSDVENQTDGLMDDMSDAAAERYETWRDQWTDPLEWEGLTKDQDGNYAHDAGDVLASARYLDHGPENAQGEVPEWPEEGLSNPYKPPQEAPSEPETTQKGRSSVSPQDPGQPNTTPGEPGEPTSQRGGPRVTEVFGQQRPSGLPDKVTKWVPDETRGDLNATVPFHDAEIRFKIAPINKKYQISIHKPRDSESGQDYDYLGASTKAEAKEKVNEWIKRYKPVAYLIQPDNASSDHPYEVSYDYNVARRKAREMALRMLDNGVDLPDTNVSVFRSNQWDSENGGWMDLDGNNVGDRHQFSPDSKPVHTYNTMLDYPNESRRVVRGAPNPEYRDGAESQPTLEARVNAAKERNAAQPAPVSQEAVDNAALESIVTGETPTETGNDTATDTAIREMAGEEVPVSGAKALSGLLKLKKNSAGSYVVTTGLHSPRYDQPVEFELFKSVDPDTGKFVGWVWNASFDSDIVSDPEPTMQRALEVLRNFMDEPWAQKQMGLASTPAAPTTTGEKSGTRRYAVETSNYGTDYYDTLEDAKEAARTVNREILEMTGDRDAAKTYVYQTGDDGRSYDTNQDPVHIVDRDWKQAIIDEDAQILDKWMQENDLPTIRKAAFERLVDAFSGSDFLYDPYALQRFIDKLPAERLRPYLQSGESFSAQDTSLWEAPISEGFPKGVVYSWSNANEERASIEAILEAKAPPDPYYTPTAAQRGQAKRTYKELKRRMEQARIALEADRTSGKSSPEPEYPTNRAFADSSPDYLKNFYADKYKTKEASSVTETPATTEPSQDPVNRALESIATNETPTETTGNDAATDRALADIAGEEVPDAVPDETQPRVSYDTLIKIAADSVENLRRSDVFRVLDSAPEDLREGLAEYIRENRPDLAQEIEDWIIESRPEEPRPVPRAPSYDLMEHPSGIPTDGRVIGTIDGDYSLAITTNHDGSAYQLLRAPMLLSDPKPSDWEVVQESWNDPRELLEKFAHANGGIMDSDIAQTTDPAVKAWLAENKDRIDTDISQGRGPESYSDVENASGPKKTREFLRNLSDEQIDALREATRGIARETPVEGTRQFRNNRLTGNDIVDAMTEALKPFGLSLDDVDSNENYYTDHQKVDILSRQIQREFLSRRGLGNPDQGTLDLDTPLPESERYLSPEARAERAAQDPVDKALEDLATPAAPTEPRAVAPETDTAISEMADGVNNLGAGDTTQTPGETTASQPGGIPLDKPLFSLETPNGARYDFKIQQLPDGQHAMEVRQRNRVEEPNTGEEFWKTVSDWHQEKIYPAQATPEEVLEQFFNYRKEFLNRRPEFYTPIDNIHPVVAPHVERLDYKLPEATPQQTPQVPAATTSSRPAPPDPYDIIISNGNGVAVTDEGIIAQIKRDNPGIDPRNAYNEYVKATGLRPSLDMKEFLRLFAATSEASGSGRVVRFAPTHYDTVTDQYVMIEPPEGGKGPSRVTFQNGMTGTVPNTSESMERFEATPSAQANSTPQQTSQVPAATPPEIAPDPDIQGYLTQGTSLAAPETTPASGGGIPVNETLVREVRGDGHWDFRIVERLGSSPSSPSKYEAVWLNYENGTSEPTSVNYITEADTPEAAFQKMWDSQGPEFAKVHSEDPGAIQAHEAIKAYLPEEMQGVAPVGASPAGASRITVETSPDTPAGVAEGDNPMARSMRPVAGENNGVGDLFAEPDAPASDHGLSPDMLEYADYLGLTPEEFASNPEFSQSYEAVKNFAKAIGRPDLSASNANALWIYTTESAERIFEQAAQTDPSAKQAYEEFNQELSRILKGEAPSKTLSPFIKGLLYEKPAMMAQREYGEAPPSAVSAPSVPESPAPSGPPPPTQAQIDDAAMGSIADPNATPSVTAATPGVVENVPDSWYADGSPSSTTGVPSNEKLFSFTDSAGRYHEIGVYQDPDGSYRVSKNTWRSGRTSADGSSDIFQNASVVGATPEEALNAYFEKNPGMVQALKTNGATSHNDAAEALLTNADRNATSASASAPPQASVNQALEEMASTSAPSTGAAAAAPPRRQLLPDNRPGVSMSRNPLVGPLRADPLPAGRPGISMSREPLVGPMPADPLPANRPMISMQRPPAGAPPVAPPSGGMPLAANGNAGRLPPLPPELAGGSMQPPPPTSRLGERTAELPNRDSVGSSGGPPTETPGAPTESRVPPKFGPWWIPGMMIGTSVIPEYEKGISTGQHPYGRMLAHGLGTAAALKGGHMLDQWAAPLAQTMVRENAIGKPLVNFGGVMGAQRVPGSLTRAQRLGVFGNTFFQKGLNAMGTASAATEALTNPWFTDQEANKGLVGGLIPTPRAALNALEKGGGVANAVLTGTELAGLGGMGLEALGYSAPGLLAASEFAAPVALAAGIGYAASKGIVEPLTRRYHGGQWGDVKADVGAAPSNPAAAREWAQQRLRLANQYLRANATKDAQGHIHFDPESQRQYQKIINETGSALRSKKGLGMSAGAVQNVFSNAYQNAIHEDFDKYNKERGINRDFDFEKSDASSLYNIDPNRHGAAWRKPTVGVDNWGNRNSSTDEIMSGSSLGRIGNEPVQKGEDEGLMHRYLGWTGFF